MLLYDRKTQSLWSQIRMQAISGPSVGQRLQLVPSDLTTWAGWQRRHPDTQVLSAATGFNRDYSRTPYPEYEHNDEIWFPLAFRSAAYHPKQRVLGISVGHSYMALPYSELATVNGDINITLGGQKMVIRYDPLQQSAQAFDDQNRPLAALSTYWFAWYAFHPNTLVFKP